MINVINEKTRRIVCKNIYENYIKDFSNQLACYKEFSSILKIAIPETSYTNFRDALFHYIKLYNVGDEKELACQMFAVQEHVGRALTDIEVLFLKIASTSAEDFTLDKKNPPNIISDMQVFLHKMRSAIIFKRTKGMMINDNIPFDDNSLSTLNILKDFTDYIEKNNLIGCYYDYINRRR